MSRPVSVASRLSLRLPLRPVVSSRPLLSAISSSARLPTRLPTSTTLQRSTSFTPRTYSTMSDHGDVVNITSDAEFKGKVTSSQDTVVLDCFASWCGPCKMIAPRVAEFSKAYPQAKFYQIDIDQLPETAGELGIRSMPTFIFFKGGKEVDRVVGADPVKLEGGIKSLIA